jgi:signal transduction histidine kinase
MERLSRQLLEVQENERRHLARELHDEVMQTLTALKLNLGAVAQTSAAAQQLEESVETVDDLVEQIRNLSLDLRPSMLDDLGLVAALEWYCERQARRLALPVVFTAEPLPFRPSLEIETTCFRVVQEALTNTAKHARATQVWVDLRHQGGTLFVAISDNGVGFDVAATRLYASQGSGIGLRGMEERLRLVGGQLDITSLPGRGAEIRARLPATGRAAGRAPVATADEEGVGGPLATAREH